MNGFGFQRLFVMLASLVKEWFSWSRINLGAAVGVTVIGGASSL